MLPPTPPTIWDLDVFLADLSAQEWAQRPVTQTYLRDAVASLRAVSAPVVNVKSFGAKGDGVTDDAPAFRAAALALSTALGGTMYVPKGLYKLSTADLTYQVQQGEYCIFNLDSNCEVRCAAGASFWLDGATLSVTAPFNAGSRFNTIGIKRGTINTGVYGANFTTNGWVLDIAFRSVAGVCAEGDRFTIDNCTFRNLPGRNMLKVGYGNLAFPLVDSFPVDGLISNCEFVNGDQNVPGNTLADDASFVYLNGSGTKVRNCTFKNDVAPVNNLGGVEMHGSKMSVEGCTFINLKPGIYVTVGDGLGTYAESNSIIGNTFTTCVGGIEMPDFINGLVIQGNHFVDCSPSPYWSIFADRNDTTGVTLGDRHNVVISGNTFRYTARAIRAAIRVPGLIGSVISNNTFEGISDPIEFPLASNYDTDGVAVFGNISRTPVAAPGQSTGLVIFGNSAVFGGNYKNVEVFDNVVLADAGTTTTAVIAAVSGNGVYTNCAGRNNFVSAAVTDGVLGTGLASIDYVPQVPNWAQTGGTATTANGSNWIRGQQSELITLSTSGTTTDSAANLLRPDSIIEAVVARVVVTIATATDWKLGDATIAGRFSAANATLAAGTTQVGTVMADQTGTSGPRQVGSAKVRITTTGTPSAGQIRVTVYSRQFIAPTS